MLKSFELPERKPVNPPESIEELEALLSECNVEGWQQWGAEELPSSNPTSKLLANLGGKGYSLWLLEDGTLQRQCDTLRSYITQVQNNESYVLRAVYSKKAGQEKRKWDIESSIGGRREGGESDESLLSREVKEEIGADVNSSNFDITLLTGDDGLYVERESSSFPGLSNIFKFTDFRLVIRSPDGDSPDGLYDVNTVTAVSDVDGTTVGWGWDRVLSAELAMVMLCGSDSLAQANSNPEDIRYPNHVLPIHYLKTAVSDEKRRRPTSRTNSHCIFRDGYQPRFL